MPFTIVERDGKHCVVKESDQDGHAFGCHDDKDSAVKQIGAIESSEKRQKAMDDLAEAQGQKVVQRVPQAEAEYTPDYMGSDGHCASCRWFAGWGCQVVENYPLDILPTGRSNRYERATMPVIEPYPTVPVPVVLKEVSEPDKTDDISDEPRPSGEGDNTRDKEADKKAPRKRRASPIAQLYDKAKAVLVRPNAPEVTGFKVYDAGEVPLWLAIYSNNFQDRDGEWFSEKAHDRYLKRVDAGIVPLPELWYWHENVMAHGKALEVARDGHFMLAIGEFEDTPLAHRLLDRYQNDKERRGVSHGFRYRPSRKQAGVYHDYNTFEISPLPHKVASNPLTLPVVITREE